MVAAHSSATVSAATPNHPIGVMQRRLVRDILQKRQPDAPRYGR
jgi:hypothetical protein